MGQLSRPAVQQLLFGTENVRRFTQCSPVMPDVWLAYNESGQKQDLLFTPHESSHAAVLYKELREQLKATAGPSRARDWHITYNDGYVVAKLTFRELVCAALPLTNWWKEYVWGPKTPTGKPITETEKKAAQAHPADAYDRLRKKLRDIQVPKTGRDLADRLRARRAAAAGAAIPRLGRKTGTGAGTQAVDKDSPDSTAAAFEPAADLLWLMDIVGSIELASRLPGTKATKADGIGLDDPALDPAEVVKVIQELVRGIEVGELPPPSKPILWSVNLNRRGGWAVWKSSSAVKADAARRLFDVSCKGLRWAVIDSGIDAFHKAFRARRDVPGSDPDRPARRVPYEEPFEPGPDGKAVNRTRVAKTYDFTRLRDLLARPWGAGRAAPQAGSGEIRFTRWERTRQLDDAKLVLGVEAGRLLDWDRLAPQLEVPVDGGYEARGPVHFHGTHVAGILAADWRVADGCPHRYDVVGMCPDLELWDLRVFDANGRADEFTVLAALQFVRFLNSTSARLSRPFIHGVNVSMSLYHKVQSFACGRTPVCDECQRLINSGSVVVAAAGNSGHNTFMTSTGGFEGYSDISITDPGNADGVITVGATHRQEPHTYGVSYFSSRGPTGDGRLKPDLVAPGEKVVAPVPGGDHGEIDTKDGTSMAAPHVSGAAAMLMARHEELIGNPVRIKEILCSTATDLGRDRTFQGRGMLDVLRALQSI